MVEISTIKIPALHFQGANNTAGETTIGRKTNRAIK